MTTSRTAVLIVGLPGSGKTTLAQQTYVPQGYTLLDDPTAPSDLRVLAGLSRVVITDPSLCRPAIQEKATQLLSLLGYTEITWVFFENDPDAAFANLRRTPDSDVRKEIDVLLLTRLYTIPEGVSPLPIYRSTL